MIVCIIIQILQVLVLFVEKVYLAGEGGGLREVGKIISSTIVSNILGLKLTKISNPIDIFNKDDGLLMNKWLLLNKVSSAEDQHKLVFNWMMCMGPN